MKTYTRIDVFTRSWEFSFQNISWKWRFVNVRLQTTEDKILSHSSYFYNRATVNFSLLSCTIEQIICVDDFNTFMGRVNDLKIKKRNIVIVTDNSDLLLRVYNTKSMWFIEVQEFQFWNSQNLKLSIHKIDVSHTQL